MTWPERRYALPCPQYEGKVLALVSDQGPGHCAFERASKRVGIAPPERYPPEVSDDSVTSDDNSNHHFGTAKTLGQHLQPGDKRVFLPRVCLALLTAEGQEPHHSRNNKSRPEEGPLERLRLRSSGPKLPAHNCAKSG